MKKSNTICAIYRRLGKCLAYANGRCHKVHDPRFVIVCPKFLIGSCHNEKCLLSHNANLHKMPVCKYFLQGLCQKNRECLYLHKKMTDDTKLCAEFLKGYCPKADKVKLKFLKIIFCIFTQFPALFITSSAIFFMTSCMPSIVTRRNSRSSAKNPKRMQRKLTKVLKKRSQFVITSTSRNNHSKETCQSAAESFNSCRLIFHFKFSTFGK